MTDIAISHRSLIDDPSLRTQVSALLTQRTEDLGISPLSEQFVLGLDDARLGHEHAVVHTDGHFSGLIAVDRSPEVPVAELLVRPDGVQEATALIESVGGKVDVWAHGDPLVGTLAEARKVRELLVMSLDTPVPDAAIPDGMTLLNLVDSRRNWGSFVDQEFLRVNNEAFSWHPEQGNWGEQRWERAQQVDWFDPEGLLLLWSGVAESVAPELLGFHWTKCPKSQVVNDIQTLGEVYVVGLSDSSRGRGLGKVIILTGINYLRGRGCEQVILYVEADNKPAVGAYEKLGFKAVESHVLYRFFG